jgi:hypothetical protein
VAGKGANETERAGAAPIAFTAACHHQPAVHANEQMGHLHVRSEFN